MQRLLEPIATGGGEYEGQSQRYQDRDREIAPQQLVVAAGPIHDMEHHGLMPQVHAVGYETHENDRTPAQESPDLPVAEVEYSRRQQQQGDRGVERLTLEQLAAAEGRHSLGEREDEAHHDEGGGRPEP